MHRFEWSTGKVIVKIFQQIGRKECQPDVFVIAKHAFIPIYWSRRFQAIVKPKQTFLSIGGAHFHYLCFLNLMPLNWI